ncbi:extracellular solute-binding protein [Streptococcus orisasini]|uniref:extracellular solute-binding protein n=1 Tax=Streptococcus orisasini TaxID=1080071 RepID=UPI00070F36FB|nr:extracellular solute-binding protein [Streptococcus orisasini]
MKWYKKVTLLAVLVVTSLALAACQSSSSKGSKVTLEYFNQKKEMSGVLKEIAKDFEKENPDIHVKVVDVPSPGEVLKSRMLSGDIPDVINIYPQNVDFQEWAKAGYFEDMTNKAYVKNIKNNYARKYAIKKKIYNVPLSANAYGFFYNKTAFDKLGLKVPQTWDEFEKLVDTIIQKKETPFAIAGSESWTLNGYNQLAFATVAGSGKAVNNYLRFSKPGSIKTSDAILKGDLRRLNLLRKKKALQANWQGASYNDALVSFAKGDALITPNGSWALPIIKQQEPNFKVATFAFPGKKKGEELTVGAGDLALSISSKTKHKTEANKFVAYMTSAKAMQKYYNADGSPVAVKGVKEKTNSELAGLSRLAFTDKHMVWLAQDWTSENDFFTLTTNYLMTGNKKDYADDLNAFFNPMKADVD